MLCELADIILLVISGLGITQNFTLNLSCSTSLGKKEGMSMVGICHLVFAC